MVLSLLKLSTKKFLKTKRGISLQTRKDIREFVRLLESSELAEKEEELKKAVDSGIAENVDKIIEEWIDKIDKGVKEVLDEEADIVIEEKKSFKNSNLDKKLFQEVARFMKNNKQLQNSNKGRAILNRMAVLQSKLSSVDEAIISTLRKEVLVMRDQLKNEEHVNNIIVKANTIKEASDDAWDMTSDVKNPGKDTDKINDTEKEELEILRTTNLTDKQLGELSIDEDKLEKEILKLDKDFDKALEDFLYLIKFSVHFYFVFVHKLSGKINNIIKYLEEKKFPSDHLIIIKKYLNDEEKDINKITSKIYNALVRLRTKVPDFELVA